MWLIKWKLMLTTLPYVAAVVLLRWILENVFGFRGVVELQDVGVVMTGGVFLLGFMLTGVLSDYKESEKMPAELACALEALEELFDLAAVSKPKLDPVAQKLAVQVVADGIVDKLLGKLNSDEIYARLGTLNDSIHNLEQVGTTPLLSGRALGELHTIRRFVARMDVISRTSFLASGYALLETLVVVVLSLVLAARYKSEVTTYTLATFVSMIFVYMLRLIKDVDDPFEYSADGTQSGAAEIELFPLMEYRVRLAKRIDELAARRAGRPPPA
jgi:hypothetical protein